MKLRSFDQYGELRSKDPRTFEKRVAFACSESYGIDVFELVKSPNELGVRLIDTPIVRWHNFEFASPQINENLFIFNVRGLPSFEKVLEDFTNAQFIPKTTRNRSEVKRLKFPIIAHSGHEKQEFKTYGKFKKAERFFDKFSEKKTPLTRFDVISHRGRPIHLQERINGMGFDGDLSSFKYLDQVQEISKAIHSKYGADFYHSELIESAGSLYLTDLTTSYPLTPSQGVKMYESAYESYYETKLPNFFKRNLFEKYVKPYYQRKYYDSLLIKPKNSIDFKQFAPGDSH